MDQSESLRRLMGESPTAAAALMSFNSNPAAYAHPEQQRRLLPELPQAVWLEPRVAGRLSAQLLARSGLGDATVYETPKGLWPVVLLRSDRLQRLALHIGALVLGIRIRSSLSRDHVLGWKRKLGEEAYSFAMNSAALLPSGLVPLDSVATSSAEEIGGSIILAALENEPIALRDRVALKLPPAFALMKCDAQKARRLVMMVAQIVEGEWCSSFGMRRK